MNGGGRPPQVGDWFVNARARKVVPKLELLLAQLDAQAEAGPLATIAEEVAVTTAEVIITCRGAAKMPAAPATPSCSEACAPPRSRNHRRRRR